MIHRSATLLFLRTGLCCVATVSLYDWVFLLYYEFLHHFLNIFHALQSQITMVLHFLTNHITCCFWSIHLPQFAGRVFCMIVANVLLMFSSNARFFSSKYFPFVWLVSLLYSVNAPVKHTFWVFSRTRSKADFYTYLSEVEPVEFAVTNNGYLSTLHPDGTQKNIY